MSAATSNLDDVEVDRSLIDGDGKSTVDLYEVPEQVGLPDGKSTVDVSGYIGGERVLESVEHGIGDNTVALTSEPTSKHLDSAHKQDVPKTVDSPLAAGPISNVENLAKGTVTLEEAHAEQVGKASAEADKPKARRTRAKAATEAEPSTPAQAEEASTAGAQVASEGSSNE